MVILLGTALALVPAGTASPRTENPGLVTYAWRLPATEDPAGRVHVRRFKTRGGLIKSVRVLIAGKPVPGPPQIAVVGCSGTRKTTTAQKSWLWDGRNVYVSLLLQPGDCPTAKRRIHVRVLVRTVGT